MENKIMELEALIMKLETSISEKDQEIIELEESLKKASRLFDDINGIIGEASKEGIY